MNIEYEDFRKVQIRVGTILEVKENEKARKPALVLEIDFGEGIGVKTTSKNILKMRAKYSDQPMSSSVKFSGEPW